MKEIYNILEQLTKKPDYLLDLGLAFENQPQEVKDAFINQDETKIKSLFGVSQFPDRDKVVSIFK